MKKQNRFSNSSIIILILLRLTTCTVVKTSLANNLETTTDSDVIEYERPINKFFNKGINQVIDKDINKLKDNLKEDDHLENDEIEDLPDKNVPQKDRNVSDTIKTSNQTVDEYDEHSEIESTTTTSLFDNLNVTLPSLSRMIDMAEEGKLDILNQTQPRRILIDLNSNEEIIGPNDINKLFIDNDFDNHDFTDLLSAPGNYIYKISNYFTYNDI